MPLFFSTIVGAFKRNVNESYPLMLIVFRFLGLFLLFWVHSLSALERVNINSAEADELARVIHGVGEQKAKAIILHRSQNGRFNTVFELEEVPGIGEKTIRNNIERLKLQD